MIPAAFEYFRPTSVKEALARQVRAEHPSLNAPGQKGAVEMGLISAEQAAAIASA